MANSFDEEDAAILKGVADQLAVAIENNRLIRATAETTALRETNRLKDEFVSMVSHELRTPLASVKGYSRTLLAENADWDAQTRREFLQIIADESDKLQELVENLLEMSRIGAGRLPISPEPLLLKPFVKELVDRVANQYPDTAFKCNIAHGLPVVEGDPRRLEQVLVNLLQNAAKYSGSHTVWVGASYGGGDEVTLCVQDKGIGMEPGRQRLRHGAGPGNRPRAGGGPGRAHLGREQGGGGHHLLFHAAHAEGGRGGRPATFRKRLGGRLAGF
jgi:two-component system sensor histidine kinase KdpD